MRAELVQLGSRACRSVVRPQRRLPRPGAYVALTFDDGPDPESSPQVLDLLAAAGATATFFLVGERAARHPELVRRIAADGHAVGSHSWSHPRPWELSARQLHDDYARGHEAVQDALGRSTALFRPPHGHLGAGGLMALLRLRLRPVLWTHDPEDWAAGTTRAQILERLADVQAGDVVLLHDALVPVVLPGGGPSPGEEGAEGRAETIAAVPRLLQALDRAGLRPTAWPQVVA